MKKELKTKSIFTNSIKKEHIVIDYSGSANSGLQFITFSGLPHTTAAEKAATDLTLAIFGNKMIAPLTLNNWKGSILQIRFATNREELNWLICGYLADKDNVSCSERSLLFE